MAEALKEGNSKTCGGSSPARSAPVISYLADRLLALRLLFLVGLLVLFFEALLSVSECLAALLSVE